MVNSPVAVEPRTPVPVILNVTRAAGDEAIERSIARAEQMNLRFFVVFINLTLSGEASDLRSSAN
jgi:hypothetical protein